MSSSPTASAAPPATEEELNELDAAERRLIESNNAHWRSKLTNGDGNVIRAEEGVFTLEPLATTYVRSGAAEKPKTLAVLVIGLDQWVRSGSPTGSGGCWVHRAFAEEDAVGIDGYLLLAPAMATMLRSGHMEHVDETTIDAKVDARLVAGAMGDLQYLMGGPLDGLVAVQFSLSDGMLTGWTATVDDLIAQARRVGLEPDPRLEGAGLELRVTLDRVGESVVAPAPPTGKIVEQEPGEVSLDALARCGGDQT